MREVSHRAKNTLSLVQVIARQTAAHEREDFIERFNERLQALAANQDMLVKNETSLAVLVAHTGLCMLR